MKSVALGGTNAASKTADTKACKSDDKTTEKGSCDKKAAACCAGKTADNGAKKSSCCSGKSAASCGKKGNKDGKAPKKD